MKTGWKLLAAVAAALSVCSADASAKARNSVQIDLPWIAQKTPNECGRAALASLSARHRRDVEETYAYLPEVAENAPGYTDGLIKKLAPTLGLKLHDYLQQTSIADRKSICEQSSGFEKYLDTFVAQIRAGRPILIVAVESNSPHYVVLSGYRGDEFEVLDPLTRETRLIGRTKIAQTLCKTAYRAWFVEFLPANRNPLPARAKP
jgi:ABC-type bacteriocin/lantibiotic exporter with double-glycine peptidase domain